MKITPLAAFGYAIFRVEANVGDSRVVELGVDGLVTSGYYFYTKGRAEVEVSETGEKLEDRTTGWLNLEHPDARASTTDGNLLLTFPVETEWYCIPHKHNKKGLPTLTAVIINEGGSHEFEKGTNFYLCRGTLEINTKIFTGPCQIRVRSGDSTAEASKDCYGLIFT